MLSLIKYRYQIYEALNINSDDTNIDSRLIDDLIAQQRSLWVRNEYNKNRSIIDDIVQDLCCVDLEVADRTQCPKVPLDCYILRTKEEIPAPVEFHDKNGILRVGPLDVLGKPYSIITYPRAAFAGNGRYNTKEIFTFYKNKRLYFTSADPKLKYLTKVTVRGIWDNPKDAGKYCDENGVPCFDDTQPYPLKEWMWVYIKPLIVEELLRKIQIPEDNKNDAQADVKQTN